MLNAKMQLFAFFHMTGRPRVWCATYKYTPSVTAKGHYAAKGVLVPGFLAEFATFVNCLHFLKNEKRKNTSEQGA